VLAARVITEVGEPLRDATAALAAAEGAWHAVPAGTLGRFRVRGAAEGATSRACAAWGYLPRTDTLSCRPPAAGSRWCCH
jgi:hypothetical protein